MTVRPGARIELPDFVTLELAQDAYRRAQWAQRYAQQNPLDQACKEWMKRGVRAAQDRDPRTMLMLERTAEILRRLNDEQQSRLTQEDHQRQEFTEFSTWRSAYEVADDEARKGAQWGVFAWIYAAAYEAAHHGRKRPHDSFR